MGYEDVGVRWNFLIEFRLTARNTSSINIGIP